MLRGGGPFAGALRRALEEKYPFIAWWVETDCKSGYGFESAAVRLPAALCDLIGHREWVRGKFPKAWHEAKEYFATMTENYLPYTSFQKLAEEKGVRPEGIAENFGERVTGAMRLRFSLNPLPKGILPGFITRTHILSDDLPKWRWVNGVVLALGGAQALVCADHAERMATVTLTGRGRPGWCRWCWSGAIGKSSRNCRNCRRSRWRSRGASGSRGIQDGSR